MSGGVDSSVAALLLKNQGYDVTGVYMRCWGDGSNVTVGINCAERDAEDARRVAEQLHAHFYVFDFEKEYKREVMQYMIEGYKKGITPNPDVMCNKEIKFGLFLKRARALGADYIATGHYVRLISPLQHRLSARSSGKLQSALSLRRPALGETELVEAPRAAAQKKLDSLQLYVAKDNNKDQSYFLWTLAQAQLKYCLFPIGDYLKSEVREIAKKAKLVTAEKKDSQGICFLGKVDTAEFLKKRIRTKKGNIITPEGRVIGVHEGAELYTIGQRHGFTVQEKKSKQENQKDTQPHYVVKKDIVRNTLTVAEGEQNTLLLRKEVKIKNIHFIASLTAGNSVALYARIRYRQPLVSACLVKKGKSWGLIFQKPVRFVASGQSAVFYTKNGEMIGGGVIV